MPIDFLSILTPEQRSRQETYARNKAVVEAMADTQFADHVEYCLKNCAFPHRFQPGEPVYDGAMAHVLIPEMIRRLRQPSADHDIFIIWRQIDRVVTALCWRSTEAEALAEMEQIRTNPFHRASTDLVNDDGTAPTLWVAPLSGA